MFKFFAQPFLFTAFFLSGFITAQSDSISPTSGDLYNEIAHMDSVIFDAYNNKNIEILKTTFAKDLEFYHDEGGLTNYDQVINNLIKVFAQDNSPVRTLVKGSMEVYPVNNYGAIQTASHTFCHKENGRDDCGTFKFVHIWKKENNAWKLTRVVSYGH